MWQSSREIMDAIEASHTKLLNGESTGEHAHVEARLFGNALKLLAIELEHARLTGRLRDGSEDLPAFVRKKPAPTSGT